VAANAALACPDVNYVLIPEVPFDLHGDRGFLKLLEERFTEKVRTGYHPHTVAVVAEGAGQELIKDRPSGRDASGNIRLGDIGIFLRDEIKAYFKGRFDVNLKYIDPSYIIRSAPANAHDSVYCGKLAQYAAHAGMAGKTDLMVGYWNGAFTHVPIPAAVESRKKVDPEGELWRSVLFATGQPWVMKD